jgi:hypothetical protein
MSHPTGTTLPLSLPRRLAGDVLHFARKVPTEPLQRRMRLSAVAEARETSSLRPSWTALFTKAYGFIGAASPLLRRAYLSFPRERLYEHSVHIATVAVERRLRDEDAVLFAQLREPQKLSLAEIDAELRRFQDDPLETVAPFRRALRLSRWPRPLRRLLWWGALNFSGRRRAHLLGTCAVAADSGFGTAATHPLTPLTTTLSYGPVEPDGCADVRLTYDARVLDGPTVARALADLERALNHEVLAELRYLAAVGDAA